jgi:hypothetical protein
MPGTGFGRIVVKIGSYNSAPIVILLPWPSPDPY